MTTNGTAAAGPFRVGIVGAGIAGLAAALSLRRVYPPGAVQVTIYEQAAELREVGASIGLNPSGLRTLDRLGVDAALDGSVAFRQPSGWPMIYRHWRTGEELGHDEAGGDVEERHGMARFHRAHLQRALLEALPADVEMRLGVRVRDVQVGEPADEEQGAVTVAFDDSSSAVMDLLIGADGIHSRTRRLFAPDHQLKWTGMVALRAAFDISAVQNIDGLPEDAVFWIGHDRTLFTSKLGNNQYTIVGSYNCNPNDSKAPLRDAKWEGSGDVEFLRELYRGWNPVVESILNAVPYVKTYPNHAGTALASLTFDGRVALLGDAAHTHGGAFAAGGSLAINDAYAFTLALAHVWPPGVGESVPGRPTRGQLATALRLYDETRRPLVTRLLHVVHSSAQARRWAAEKRDGDNEGETDAELRARIANRPDMRWLTEHDVEKEFLKVVSRHEN